MTDRLAEIEARLDAATPGPWDWDTDDFTGDLTVESLHDYMHGARMFIAERINQGADDAQLIAAAPTDLRDLLAVAKAARELAAILRGYTVPYTPTHKATEELLVALANLEGGAT